MKYALWAVLFLGLISGCVLFTTGTNITKVPVYLTDNPSFDIEQLQVKISDVTYHYSLNGEGYDATATLLENEFDLLSLAGTEVQFFEMELPEGAELDWIRLYVDAATAVVNGQSETVNIPSRKIKIIKPIIVQSGDEIVLDFDVARSLRVVQGKNQYILRPVIVPYHRERHEYEHGPGEGEEYRYRYEVEGELKETLAGTTCLVALFEGETSSATLVDLEITDDDFSFEELKEATYTLYVCEFTLPETTDTGESSEEEFEVDEDEVENVNSEIQNWLSDLTSVASVVFYLNDSTITYIQNSADIELRLDD
ncbi:MULTISPECIES: DUF4382 domain-containing protein [Thermotoga]|uniref:DUF4382 domain-containing protein n=1 Tax=Thermotoga neapolitana (strain ATCC 49049 / DSM 4359 / NBRC 107923 / NS-E) TaxID=309803 RepID=B9K7M7_THENN|nr:MULTISPECIES: DUF4382 domain-containing protein [Thermotoga]ACM22960.1 Putative uncharacterized protein [Thermotoga neapolitana DSM 4359]AJG40879.1 hypothetical protein TRQ7_05345 [Thermotoga sp. RQ7]KFZ21961.1 hypothetical protein LA10_04033 [Thermotoga neapolitana LA10]HBF10390.1 DUF4382 domain-containing protein [Thermotoga neapolitana]